MTCNIAMEGIKQGVLSRKHTLLNMLKYWMYSYLLIIANQRQFMIFHLYRLDIDLYTSTYKIKYFHNHSNFRYIMEY